MRDEKPDGLIGEDGEAVARAENDRMALSGKAAWCKVEIFRCSTELPTTRHSPRSALTYESTSTASIRTCRRMAKRSLSCLLAAHLPPGRSKALYGGVEDANSGENVAMVAGALGSLILS
jgi:hypothetical protein